MFNLVGGAIGLCGLLSIVYLAKPGALVEFARNFPYLTQHDIPLLLLLINYILLAFGVLSSIRRKQDRSDIPLLSAGLIASATLGLSLCISFLFNVLWSFVTPRYLMLAIIILYFVNLGIPALVYGIKTSSPHIVSDEFKTKKLIGDTKAIISELRLTLIQNKISTSEIDKINAKLGSEHIASTELMNILEEVSLYMKNDVVSSSLVQRIENIKNLIAGV